ncbi:MAG: ComF family protein [Clostridia bacterium]|nr:ComF family protein [Clostridia bacterium]
MTHNKLNLGASLARAAASLRGLVFPPRCAGCGVLLGGQTPPFCARCATEVMELRQVFCPRCRQPVVLCRCAPHDGITTPIYSLYPYRTGRKDVIARMLLMRKEHDDPDVRAFLAAQMEPLCLYAASQRADIQRWVLAYPPRSKAKKQSCGFDQSQTLAKALSARTGFPLVPCVRRVRGRNAVQKHLGAEARFVNARASYEFDTSYANAIAGAGILLIDDIVTTGATLQVCTDLLLEAGAGCVAAVTAARTL